VLLAAVTQKTLELRRGRVEKTRVLFVCVHNSARSQMAEAFLNRYGAPLFEAESAGMEPGTLNPVVVDAMNEIGIDISGNRTKDVFDILKQGKVFEYVITVCDAASGKRCPYFPGAGHRLNWDFDDPSTFTGSRDEKLKRIRIVRDAIKAKIRRFIGENAVDQL
jgi:arsenate reductase (thioredoxin)